MDNTATAYWQTQQVLVTGAGGFIGSHLTRRLVELGARVRAFVHYNSRNDWGLLELLPQEVLEAVEVTCGDLTDPLLVRRVVTGCQTVFHLGALIAIPYSYQAPRHFLDTNIWGTLNVLQACLETRVEKVVHTSTSETYGSARYTPIDEEHPLQAQSPYAASKIAADKLAESFYCSFDLPVATIRPFNTFGPCQSARAVIPTIITQALVADTVRLGTLTPVRDFTFVEDTVSGFLLVAASEKSVGQVFNVGMGYGLSIGELAEAIFKLFDRPKQIVTEDERLRPEQSEVMTLICDSTKARNILGWKPAYTLEQGLRCTVDYIRSHLHRYKPTIFNR
ncbi:MAG: NAD-dependent epimerase/dehydratase family protein [Nitrospinota bacterium]|nr:MAG: NAD-dependent epimerase/dehydratase family protein [Nitrospinota bacterium]